MSKFRKLFVVLCLFSLAGGALRAEDARDSTSRYGVLDFFSWNHEWNAYHYPEEKIRHAASLMKEAGVGFVRMDIAWSDVEPNEGEWVWTKYDRILDILAEYDIKVLCTLGYNPRYLLKKLV
jgi:beta-galactosidase GanA